jgi:hypothetical protein
MAAEDLTRIQTEARVSAVLSLQHDACLEYWGIDYDRMHRHGSRLGLVMERCPVRDFDVIHQRQRLPLIVAKLAQLHSQGYRIYVHCTAGLGRSPLAALGYLTWVQGLTPEQAYRMILAARPNASPAWEAYHGAHADLAAKYRRKIEHRAYRLYEMGDRRSPFEHWLEAEGQVLPVVLQESIA